MYFTYLDVDFPLSFLCLYCPCVVFFLVLLVQHSAVNTNPARSVLGREREQRLICAARDGGQVPGLQLVSIALSLSWHIDSSWSPICQSSVDLSPFWSSSDPSVGALMYVYIAFCILLAHSLRAFVATALVQWAKICQFACFSSSEHSSRLQMGFRDLFR